MTLTDDYDLSGLTKGKINLKVLFKDGDAVNGSPTLRIGERQTSSCRIKEAEIAKAI